MRVPNEVHDSDNLKRSGGGRRGASCARVPGVLTPTAGLTGMMVTARVADSGLATRRSPLQRAAGDENFWAQKPFYSIFSVF